MLLSSISRNNVFTNVRILRVSTGGMGKKRPHVFSKHAYSLRGGRSWHLVWVGEKWEFYSGMQSTAIAFGPIGDLAPPPYLVWRILGVAPPQFWGGPIWGGATCATYLAPPREVARHLTP